MNKTNSVPQVVKPIQVAEPMPEYLSTAEAARLLGLSTTLVQTLVDQNELVAWKTRGGHRRISRKSVVNYQGLSRRNDGPVRSSRTHAQVTLVSENSKLFGRLKTALPNWKLPISVNMFESVTEALLDLSNIRPDLMVVELNMPLAEQQKTLQAIVNFNTKGLGALPIVLITQEKELATSQAASQASAGTIQIIHKPLSDEWLHAYMVGVVSACRIC
ncbi:MAG: hypothetical protein RLZ63_1372 [Pseudomonadota bacterium]|jgi:excisionase family DNA binding protein